MEQESETAVLARLLSRGEKAYLNDRSVRTEKVSICRTALK